MDPAQRRYEIIRILSFERFCTISYLASYLNVSYRTIVRDISKLSHQNIIYTQTGRYNGGVYLCPYSASETDKKRNSKLIIKKVISSFDNNTMCDFTKAELDFMRDYVKDIFL